MHMHTYIQKHIQIHTHMHTYIVQCSYMKYLQELTVANCDDEPTKITGLHSALFPLKGVELVGLKPPMI